jgi:hypothetical protein
MEITPQVLEKVNLVYQFDDEAGKQDFIKFLQDSQVIQEQREFLSKFPSTKDRVEELVNSVEYMYEAWLDALMYGKRKI